MDSLLAFIAQACYCAAERRGEWDWGGDWSLCTISPILVYKCEYPGEKDWVLCNVLEMETLEAIQLYACSRSVSRISSCSVILSRPD